MPALIVFRGFIRADAALLPPGINFEIPPKCDLSFYSSR